MKMGVLTIGLALGLACFLVTAGCGQQDAAQEMADQPIGSVLEKQAESTTTLAARTAKPSENGTRKRAAQTQRNPRRQDVESIVKDGAEEDEILVEFAGKAAQGAYDRARARAGGEFDNAREVFEKD
jgi:hypothetical protein